MGPFRATLVAITRDRLALAAFPLTAVGALALFIVVPVVSTPGNTIAFQLSITRPLDWLLMGVLALFIGATVAVEIAARRRQRGRITTAVARTTLGGASGLFGVLVGTAACTSCLASILGLVGIGFGGTLFVLQHRTPFLIGAIALSVGVLALAMRRLYRSCASCA